MDLGLSGKRAIVLAGTNGLGWATAAALAAEGCQVVVCGRNAIRQEAGWPDGIHAMRCDVGNAGDLDRFLDSAVERLGGIDVLVTNCGGPQPATTSEVTGGGWTAAVDAVLLSVVRSCRRVVPLMVDQGNGSIVCIASTSAIRPIPGLAISNTLRPAVVGFAQSLAIEVAATGVRVNCVLPGPFDTARSRQVAERQAAGRGVDPAAQLRELTGAIPSGRLGDPAEFGRTVAFLAGDANRFCTGATIVVDGGSSLRHN